jgi:hypothetical protein
MVELTLQLPDDLAMRLRPVQDRLTEIIELGLRDIAPAQHALHNEVIEFLASGPSAQSVVAFRPSVEAQAHVAELLDKNRAGLLTVDEQSELDQYESLDYLMTLIKARARQHVTPSHE